MNTVRKVLTYQVRDAIRSRWLAAYGVFFALVGETLLRLAGDPAKAQLSLINVVLLVVPLVAIVFGTVYLYGSREFVELLLAQPLKRLHLYSGLYLGLAIPLSVVFAVGLGVPFAARGLDQQGWTALAALVTTGCVLTFIFAGIATVIATRCEDRLRGLGTAIGAWLLLTVVYDGFVLFVLAAFSSYPLERVTLGLMMANPIDIGRLALLIRFDGAALMGYTGAVFLKFFSGPEGVVITIAALSGWIALPVVSGAKAFARKDF